MNAQNTDVANAQDVNKKTRNYTLFVLVMIYSSSYVDRQIISILAESIKHDMNLSDSQLGILIGFSFAIFYATLGIPIAILADRFSRRNIIAIAVIVWSAMTAVSGLAMNFTQLMLARIGVGIGEAGSSPPSHSMIADLFPLEERASALGFYSAGINIGILLGFLIGGWVDEFLGWRYAFFIVGVPGLFLGLLLLFTVKEPARTSPPKPINKNILNEIFETFKLMVSIPSMRHILIGCTLIVFVGYGTVLWNGVFFRRVHEMSPSEAGTMLALIAGFVGGIGTFFGGWLADRLAKRDKRAYTWLTAIVKLALAPFIFVLYYTDSLPLAIAMMVVASFFGGFYLSVSFAMTQSLLPPARRALGAALLLFCINIIGLGVGPSIVGFLSDFFAGYVGEQYGVRWALIAVPLINIWGAVHYYLAGHTLEHDLNNVKT